MKCLILLFLIDLTLVHAEPAARDSREAPAVPVAKQAVIVYQEELRYGGWPPNQGIWSGPHEPIVDGIDQIGGRMGCWEERRITLPLIAGNCPRRLALSAALEMMKLKKYA